MSAFDVILSGRKAAKDLAWVGRSAVDRLVHSFPVGRQIVPVGFVLSISLIFLLRTHL